MPARLPLALAAAAITVLALGAAGGPAATVLPCTGAQLTGTFSVVPGSAGAGSISYMLRLRNASAKTCFVSGLAQLRLLGRTGKPLPTRVEPAFRAGLTAVKVTLRPGRPAKAEARLSPDIPDQNERQMGPCEPKAYKVRVTPPPGGGTLLAPVSPPTTVCQHGHMQLRALSAA